MHRVADGTRVSHSSAAWPVLGEVPDRRFAAVLGREERDAAAEDASRAVYFAELARIPVNGGLGDAGWGRRRRGWAPRPLGIRPRRAASRLPHAWLGRRLPWLVVAVALGSAAAIAVALLAVVTVATLPPVRIRGGRRRGRLRIELQVVNFALAAHVADEVLGRGLDLASSITIVAHQLPLSATASKHVHVLIGASAPVVCPRSGGCEGRRQGIFEAVDHAPAQARGLHGRAAIGTDPVVELPHWHRAAVLSGTAVEEHRAAHTRRGGWLRKRGVRTM